MDCCSQDSPPSLEASTLPRTRAQSEASPSSSAARMASTTSCGECGSAVPHDVMVQEWASGRTRFDVMRSLGRQPRKVPSVSVQDGIQASRKTLPITVFDVKCEERGIAALEQYRREWDDKNKTFRLKPKHDWASNASDAWRYLSLAWRDFVPEQPKKPAKPNDYVSSEYDSMDGDSWRI